MSSSISKSSAIQAETIESTSLVRADGRSAEVLAFEVALVDFFVHATEMLGAPRSLGAIYGIVFASPAPLCFADIEARLDISKGSISQGLRVLREVGAIKAISQSDNRREFFVPDLELRNLVKRFLQERLQKQLADGSARLTQLKRLQPELDETEAETMNERLSQLKNWHDKTRSLLPVISTFLSLTKA